MLRLKPPPALAVALPLLGNLLLLPPALLPLPVLLLLILLLLCLAARHSLRWDRHPCPHLLPDPRLQGCLQVQRRRRHLRRLPWRPLVLAQLRRMPWV